MLYQNTQTVKPWPRTWCEILLCSTLSWRRLVEGTRYVTEFIEPVASLLHLHVDTGVTGLAFAVFSITKSKLKRIWNWSKIEKKGPAWLGVSGKELIRTQFRNFAWKRSFGWKGLETCTFCNMSVFATLYESWHGCKPHEFARKYPHVLVHPNWTWQWPWSETLMVVLWVNQC